MGRGSRNTQKRDGGKGKEIKAFIQVKMDVNTVYYKYAKN